MAGKKEVQKTVAFRLNLSKADERELYQAVMKHGRNVENDIYGSGGAYVKAALRHYHRQESKLELQEQYRQEMRNYLKELADEQREVFLEGLAEHDKELAVTVAEAVMRVVGSIKVSDAGTNDEKSADGIRKRHEINPAESMAVEFAKTEQGVIAEENMVEEGLPAEALFYLSNL